MKHISVKLTEEAYDKLQILRGSKSTSDYVRDLLFSDEKAVGRETAAFKNLMKDIAAMKDDIGSLMKQLPNQEGLLAVAAYLTHAMSIGNPTAYAHHTTEMKDLFQKVRATVTIGR